MTDQRKTRKPFFRLLPSWIYADDGYEALSAPEAWLLHLLAGQADEALEDGSRRGCRFGTKCIEMSKLSPSTIRKYLSSFEALGFIVKVGQGGGQGRANEYAFPAHPGALDHLKQDDDPRYKTRRRSEGNTSRETEGNTQRETEGKGTTTAPPIPTEAHPNTHRETAEYPPRVGAFHTHHKPHTGNCCAVPPTGKPPAPQKTEPENQPSEREGITRFILLKLCAGRAKADADRHAEEIADRLLALGCRGRDEARRRWQGLQVLDEDANIADLPDRWAEAGEAMETAEAVA